MDMIWLIIVGVLVAVLAGGYLGYRYGRAVQAKAQMVFTDLKKV